jgi:ATP-dependent DNA helicase RecG
MTRAQLNEIINNGENSGIEFKRDDVKPEQLPRECVALANLKGGMILLGVEDNGVISGLTKQKEELERWIMGTVFFRYIQPTVIPFYEEVILEDNKRVGIIKIEQGTSKPYAVKLNDKFEFYIRAGSTSRPATREQIIRLSQEGGMIHVESLAVSGTSFDDINLEIFRQFYNKNYGENIKMDDKETLIEKLTQLDMLVKSSVSGLVCSIAGILLFGRDPRKYLYQSGMRLIAYPSLEPDIDASVDTEINGCLAEMKDEFGNILFPGLITKIEQRLQLIIYHEKLENGGFKRIGEWDYPIDVLRELIVNSFVHRDWSMTIQNRIEIFPNRIEITSRGALPNSQTIEKILAGTQYPRNNILLKTIKDLGFMEDRGLGIRRKVIPVLKEKKFPDPVFEATEDYFKITIYKYL